MHLVLGHQPLRHQVGELGEHAAEQRPVAELAVVADGHRHHHDTAAGAQFAAAERDELMPVERGLLGVGRPHVLVGAVGDLEVSRAPAQEPG